MIKRGSAQRRHIDILHSIVKSYIETGEPVASRTISRLRTDNLSPATIRNVMADLCEEGFLSQPHTSAGRVPTALAIQSYVNSLAKARVLAAELRRLRMELNQFALMEDRVANSSRILTKMTRSIGISAAIPNAGQILDQMELVSLSEGRVLMVMSTRDRMVRNRVVALDEPLKPEDLIPIRNYINTNFTGWSLPQIQEELKKRLERQSAAYDSVLKRLTVLYSKGLLELGGNPEVYLDGAHYLIGLDLHLTNEKLRELFRTLEEKKRLLHLLDRFLEQPSGELTVKIGLEEADPSMAELSLIGVNILMRDGLSAKIAVLGPMRMDYERVISAVLHMGQAFEIQPS